MLTDAHHAEIFCRWLDSEKYPDSWESEDSLAPQLIAEFTQRQAESATTHAENAEKRNGQPVATPVHAQPHVNGADRVVKGSENGNGAVKKDTKREQMTSVA